MHGSCAFLFLHLLLFQHFYPLNYKCMWSRAVFTLSFPSPFHLVLLCQVYHKLHGLLVPSTGERLMQHYRLGPVAGVVFVTLIALVTMWHLLVCLWRPANAIERVPSTAQTMPLHEARTRQRL